MLSLFQDIFSNIDFTSWFFFNPENPLLFNSDLFLKLFFVFYAIFILLRGEKCELARKIYLIIFSFYFYYKAGGNVLDINLFGWTLQINYFVILVVCALMTDWLARAMYYQTDRAKQKGLLATIIVLNLLMLSYFKYTSFLFDNLGSLSGYEFSFTKIILPIGISFFVFEAISYAVDLYRKEMEPAKSTLDFCYYIAFFPKLVAGPIIRAKDFLPQMYKKFELSKEDLNKALFLIIIGLIKKAIISDYISTNFVDRIFDNPDSYSSFENLLGVYGYTLQIYCDFSGYSDIAIGLSLLLGFKIPANFLTPYKSQSITEFWRRWHISLSSWLRDYLYISMGGNRKGSVRTYVNLFMTMLIGGLWHGASWKFVVWGALHGGLLVVERFIKRFIPLSSENRIGRAVRIIITFHLIAFCWIFFRAENFEMAGKVIGNVANLNFDFNQWWVILSGYSNVFILVAIGYTMHFLPERFTNAVKVCFGKTHLLIQGLILGLVIWLIYATMSSGPQPFIYFQF